MLTCAALAFALSFINDNDGSDDDDGDNGIRLSDSSPASWNAISRSSRGGTFLSNDPNIVVSAVGTAPPKEEAAAPPKEGAAAPPTEEAAAPRKIGAAAPRKEEAAAPFAGGELTH